MLHQLFHIISQNLRFCRLFFFLQNDTSGPFRSLALRHAGSRRVFGSAFFDQAILAFSDLLSSTSRTACRLDASGTMLNLAPTSTHFVPIALASGAGPVMATWAFCGAWSASAGRESTAARQGSPVRDSLSFSSRRHGSRVTGPGARGAR